MLISLILNLLIVLMVSFASVAMFVGWHFMGRVSDLRDEGFKMFRFFTIDSNIVMGICSLIVTYGEYEVLAGKKEILSPIYYVIALIGTSAVTLTFIVTVFFLAPQWKKPIVLFYNSNFFYHLCVPIVSIITFIFFEKTKEIPLNSVILGVLPVTIYGIYYVINVFTHLDNGKVSKKYDFYNFVNGKKEVAGIAAIVILVVSYLISWLLWLVNRGF